MFRNESSEQNSAASRELRGSSSGLDCQGSPWFSVLPRPALSLLDRILPGRRILTAALSDPGPGWVNGVLDDLESGPQVYLQSAAGGADPLLETRPGRCLPCFPAGSLERLVDLEDLDNSQLQYRSTVSTALQVLGRSHTDPNSRGKYWGFRVSGGASGRVNSDTYWCGSPWGGGVGTAELPLQDLLWTGIMVPQPANQMTAVESAPNTWMGVEGSGALARKEKSGLHPDHHPHWFKSDQDHGYSSLEEEQVQKCPLLMETPLGDEVGGGVLTPPRCRNKAIAFIMGCPCSDDDDSQSEDADDSQLEAAHDQDDSQSEAAADQADSQSEAATDQDDRQSEAADDSQSESADHQDDSDFDGHGFSDSSVDGGPQRWWSSMNRSLDPYDPQCFSAHLYTGSSSSSSQPQEIHATLCSSQNHPSSSSSSWDDSASEVDEAESLHLWSSFCSSDPYSPLNFQAPVRTLAPLIAPVGAGVGAKTSRSHAAPPHLHPAAPPHERTEGAEERLDSGFSEPCSSSCPSSCTSSGSSSYNCRLLKKVRFSNHVEEFFTDSEEEDRRGPWEEFARDRCRFLRRCLEVEQSIAFCLQPQHRLRIYQRLSTCSPDSQSETSFEWRRDQDSGFFTA